MDADSYLVREALLSAGAPLLEPSAKRWLERRVARHGYDPQAHNLGGVTCDLLHEHGSDGSCVLVNGQPLRKFTNIRTAAGVLVATAGRAGATAARPAIDLPVSIEGFKSTHPDAEPGRAPVEVGLLPLLIPWIAAYGAYSYVNTPTEDTERRFRDLAADWEAFERAGVPRPPFGFLAADHRAWVAFREAWKAGNPDVSDLAPQEATANRVRAELFQRSGDPRYGKDRNLKSTDVLETKRVLQAADTVDREVRAVTQAAQSKTANVWDAIPWQAKAGGAAVLTLFVLTLFRDLTRGLR